MATCTRWCLMFAVCGMSAVSALADEPAQPTPSVKIEFRWLEPRPIVDVTFQKGIQTTCGDELSYPHQKPILTQADVARAELVESVFTNGLPSPQYMVLLHLTDDARQKLVKSVANERRELAVFVNDAYYGTRYLHAADIPDFVPGAGFIATRSTAAGIVDSVQSARSAADARD